MSHPDHPTEPDDPPTVNTQLATACAAFERRFGRSPRFAASAPGRVNLIGEHTDYNAGFVLPIAIDRRTVVVAAPTDCGESRIIAIDLDESFSCDLASPLVPVSEPQWANYLLGVVDQFKQRGVDLSNLDIVVTSSVPIGAGLSSSASVEVAMATLLEQVADIELDSTEKALLCRDAEHAFPGTPCGVMDMFAAVFARPDHALLLDCEVNEARHVHMPGKDDVTLLIADTTVKHELATGEYARRRAACERAARTMGLGSLRQATIEMLNDAGLTQTEHQRATHVVQENDRTLRAAELLESNDLAGFGDLMFQSHDSLRYLYEVSCDELDTLVEEAKLMRHEGMGVFGARMTGGGFGGCAIVLCKPHQVDRIIKRLKSAYQSAHDRTPRIYSAHACRGVQMHQI